MLQGLGIVSLAGNTQQSNICKTHNVYTLHFKPHTLKLVGKPR